MQTTMNENPLTHNPLNQGGAGRRKTWMTATAIVLAVVAVAGIAYSVYAWQQNQKLSADVTAKNNQIADLQKQANTPTKTTTSTTTTQPADPYAGWQSATLKYEKATFKYPSTWKLTNTSTPNGTTGDIAPGSDQVKLISPTGLTLTINTGVSGIGGPSGGVVLSTTPITTLGGNYSLKFQSINPSASVASEGTVVTTATSSAHFLPSKNLSIVGGGAPFDLISMSFFDASGNAIAKPVSDFQSDTSYNDALLIIKSLSY